MEALQSIFSVFIYLYVSYVDIVKFGFFFLIEDESVAILLSAYTLLFIPIGLLSRAVFRLSFWGTTKNISLHVYVFIMTFIWLLVSKDGLIGTPEVLTMEGRLSLIVFCIAIYGIMTQRNRVSVIQNATHNLNRSNSEDIDTGKYKKKHTKKRELNSKPFRSGVRQD